MSVTGAEKQRRYRERHRDEINQRQRERVALLSPEERERRRAQNREVNRRWRGEASSPERAAYNATEAARHKEANRARRLRVLDAYGHACACCGETCAEFLAVDHVNGGGRQHRASLGTGPAFYKWLERNGFPKDEFRLLCHNCNSARGYYGACPHEAARAASSSPRPSLPQNWN